MFISLKLARSLKFDSFREWQVNIHQIDGIAEELDDVFGYKSVISINGEVCYSLQTVEEIKTMVRNAQ